MGFGMHQSDFRNSAHHQMTLMDYNNQPIEFEAIELETVVGPQTAAPNLRMDQLIYKEMPSACLQTVQPDLLLGLNVFNKAKMTPSIKLPSGFMAYASKLGAFIAGDGSVIGSTKTFSTTTQGFCELTDRSSRSITHRSVLRLFLFARKPPKSKEKAVDVGKK
jgi:hypothetical protein